MLGVLREDLPAVDHDVERAARSRRQRRFDTKLPRNRIRQTGGLWSIVSTDAVGDGDFHAAIISIANSAKNANILEWQCGSGAEARS
jgi:hypothetical protein